MVLGALSIIMDGKEGRVLNECRCLSGDSVRTGFNFGTGLFLAGIFRGLGKIL